MTRAKPMDQQHSGIGDQRVNWVSQLIADSGAYGLSVTSGTPTVSPAKHSTDGRRKDKGLGAGVEAPVAAWYYSGK